eukprot:12401576-Karenia_brevis.AAC.1
MEHEGVASTNIQASHASWLVFLHCARGGKHVNEHPLNSVASHHPSFVATYRALGTQRQVTWMGAYNHPMHKGTELHFTNIPDFAQYSIIAPKPREKVVDAKYSYISKNGWTCGGKALKSSEAYTEEFSRAALHMVLVMEKKAEPLKMPKNFKVKKTISKQQKGKNKTAMHVTKKRETANMPEVLQPEVIAVDSDGEDEATMMKEDVKIAAINHQMVNRLLTHFWEKGRSPILTELLIRLVEKKGVQNAMIEFNIEFDSDDLDLDDDLMIADGQFVQMCQKLMRALEMKVNAMCDGNPNLTMYVDSIFEHIDNTAVFVLNSWITDCGMEDVVEEE